MGNGGWFARTAAAVSFCGRNKTPSNQSDPCWLSPATHAERGVAEPCPALVGKQLCQGSLTHAEMLLCLAQLLPVLDYGLVLPISTETNLGDVSLADNAAHVKGLSCCSPLPHHSLVCLHFSPFPHPRLLQPQHLLPCSLTRAQDSSWYWWHGKGLALYKVWNEVSKCFSIFSSQKTEWLHWNQEHHKLVFSPGSQERK